MFARPGDDDAVLCGYVAVQLTQLHAVVSVEQASDARDVNGERTT